MVDPRSKSLVLNGKPGHLQFYSLQRDKLLYNVSQAKTRCTFYVLSQHLKQHECGYGGNLVGRGVSKCP